MRRAAGVARLAGRLPPSLAGRNGTVPPDPTKPWTAEQYGEANTPRVGNTRIFEHEVRWTPAEFSPRQPLEQEEPAVSAEHGRGQLAGEPT